MRAPATVLDDVKVGCRLPGRKLGGAEVACELPCADICPPEPQKRASSPAASDLDTPLRRAVRSRQTRVGRVRKG